MLCLQVGGQIVEHDHLRQRVFLDRGTGVAIDQHVDDTRAVMREGALQRGAELREALDALREHKVSTPFSGTTCIRGEDGRAIWFSKNILPAIRSEAKLRAAGPLSPVLQHVGLYGYTRKALDRIAALKPSRYEELEGLEQLRFIENGLSVYAVPVAAQDLPSAGIDTPQDVAKAEAALAKLGDPYKE